MGSRSTKAVLIGGMSLVIVSVAGYLVWHMMRPFDATMKTVLAKNEAIKSYVANVKTTSAGTDRTIVVDGIYTIDRARGAFASFSTTTLSAETLKKPLIFSVNDISIGADVYTKVESNNPSFKLSVPVSSKWLHFKAPAIPMDYANVAVNGPILDNLRILDSEGAYIWPLKGPETATWATETLAKYTLRLSGKTPPLDNGTLRSLSEHIGKNGTIELWIDTNAAEIRHMVFQGDSYRSTTTISSLNSPVVVEVPEGDEETVIQ